MINAGTFVTTNSANATLVACTTAGHFIGACIGGGDGTLTIKHGTTTFLVLKTTANRDDASLAPAIPIRFPTGLNATCSGTGVCTLFFVDQV